jgi:nuclear protein localization family protein 4
VNEYVELVNKNKITIKTQKYPITSKVSIDSKAAQNFQAFLRELGFQMRRMGYLLGTTQLGKKPEIEEDPNAKPDPNVDATVHEKFHDVFADVIYEPPQEGNDKKFQELQNEKLDEKVDELAGLLGMKRVGWIFSHAGGRDYLLSGEEVLKAAALQSKYGSSFVTVVVAPDAEGMTHFEAFQVSKQCVDLYEKGLLEVDPDRPQFLKTKKKVEIEKKMSNEIECLLLITNVAITSHDSVFQIGFPARNRPDYITGQKQSMERLKDVIVRRDKQLKQSFVKRISDFELLLFLTDYLSLKSDFPTLAEAVKTQNNGSAQGFEPLINAYCGLY